MWKSIGIIAWALVAILAFGAFFSFFYVRSLLHDAEVSIAAADLLNARNESQIDAFAAASRQSRQFIEQQNARFVRNADTLRDYCQLQEGGQDRRWLQLCENVNSFFQEDSYATLILLDLKASAQRGSGDFADSIDTYAEAIEKLAQLEPRYTGAMDEYALKRMTLLEGQAFGLYRLERFGEAREVIDAALKLEDRETRAVSGFVYSTDLKLRCADGLENTDAEALYGRYLAQLRAALERESYPVGQSDQDDELRIRFWREFRAEDLAYFSNDQELKLVCRLPG